MAVYYVFQGETYNAERVGGYVWSPQLNKSCRRNAGYTMMTNIRKGDFILHNFNGKIVSISVAREDYYESNQPRELLKADNAGRWSDEGYRVDTNYFDFDVPVITTDYKEWLSAHFLKGSAFTRAGTGKQQYMCRLADEHAVFLLDKAIKIQKGKEVIDCLQEAMSKVVNDKESEYDLVEMELINELVEGVTSETMVPAWEGKKEAQVMTKSSKTGREIPKRDTRRAADALAHAAFQCEFNNGDRTFLRKNKKPYTEPHHLIPISKYRDFDYSVDVMENIVSLCSHCHNLLHYGRFEDKKPILEKLYNERKAALHTCGLDLTLEQLEKYYK